MAYDSIISPRALREIYLMPFMLAEKYARPWSYMTAYVFPERTPDRYRFLTCVDLDNTAFRYNRLNGTHLSEHPILKETLRGEWGSEAMIMSDW